MITGDGAGGCLEGAPFDRVLSTVAVPQVPYAWVAQTRPGGLVLTPWSSAYKAAGLLSLTVGPDGTASGGLVNTSISFMALRAQRIPRPTVADVVRDSDTPDVTDTDLHASDICNDDAPFAIGLAVPGCHRKYEPPTDADGHWSVWFLDADTRPHGGGAWAVGAGADTGVMSSPEEIAGAAGASRNCVRSPGGEFVDGVCLAGWEQQSVWGFDGGLGGFFAQLWRNTSRAQAPQLSFGGVGWPWPGCIALDIVEATRVEPVVVVAALGIADPDPRLRPAAEITAAAGAVGAQVRATPTAGPGEWSAAGYLRGELEALAWLLGKSDVCPGLRGAWRGGPPTAEQVVAERHMVTGQLYRPGSDASTSGVDAALWWALGWGGQSL